jgi:hypothetical protein
MKPPREPLIFTHPDAAKRAAERELRQHPNRRVLCIVEWSAGGYVYRPTHRAISLVQAHRARIVGRVKAEEAS